MTEDEYDFAINNLPSKKDRRIFWLSYILWLVLWFTLSLLGWVVLPHVQRFLWGSDVLFLPNPNGQLVFVSGLWLLLLLPTSFFLKGLMSLNKNLKSTYNFYEITILWMNQYSAFGKGYVQYQKRWNLGRYLGGLMMAAGVVLMFFAANSYLSASRDGLVFSPLWSISSRHYAWEEVASIDADIHREIDLNRNQKDTPVMHVSFGEHRVDIWNGLGLLGTKPEELLAFVQFAKQQYPTVTFRVGPLLHNGMRALFPRLEAERLEGFQTLIEWMKENSL